MELQFKEWFKLQENMWGNIPAKGKKPSDGWSSRGGSMGGMMQMQQPMMKKMKKK